MCLRPDLSLQTAAAPEASAAASRRERKPARGLEIGHSSLVRLQEAEE